MTQSNNLTQPRSPHHSTLISRGVVTFLAALALSMGSAAYAATDSSKHFEIETKPLADALMEFGVQSGLTVVAPTTLTAGKKAAAVRGEFTPMDALGRLLKGSGLTFARAEDGTIGIQAIASNGPVQVSAEESGLDKDLTSEKGLPEILITGSWILNLDVTRTEDDAQPYTIFDSKTIERSGATDVEEFLKQRLTMNTTFQSNSQNRGGQSGNTSSINLRGLGTNETLILIDGRRAASVTFGGAPGQPDINGIPLAAIERIEVLPSSASAIYGGSAMGGVVNVILKKNFQGGEFQYTYGRTTEGNVPRTDVSATYGFTLPDAKTHIMLSGHYQNEETLELGQRLDLYKSRMATVRQNSPTYFSSPTFPFPGGATPNIANADFPTGDLTLRDGTSLGSSFTHVAEGTAPGTSPAAGLIANAGRYDLNFISGTDAYGLNRPLMQAPLTKSLLASVRREIASSIDVYSDFQTIGNSSRGDTGNPSGGLAFIPASASTNPFQQDVLISLPVATGTPTASNSVTQRLSSGAIVRLGARWTSAIDYTWSRNLFSSRATTTDFIAIAGAFASGALNPFVDILAHPLNLAPYVGEADLGGDSTVNDINARASGPLGTLPAGSPTLTVGLEHRKEGFHNFVSAQTYPSNADSSKIEFLGQSQSATSFYAELSIPVVSSRNALPGIRSLEVQVAGRSERYKDTVGTLAQSSFGGSAPVDASPPGVGAVTYTANSPTLGIAYKPIDSLTLRASYARAFLPPLASQLLPNPVPFTDQITDPKNGGTYFVSLLGGGNPKLHPQIAKTVDLGAIWEPLGILSGLRINLEYYKITQPNYITAPTAQQVISDPAFAGRVTRDPTTGLITLIDLSLLNATLYKTNGWDAKIDYERPTAMGTVGIHLAGTLVEHDERQYAIGSRSLEYVGFPADGGENKAKANLSLSWEYRQWSLFWTAVYFGHYQLPYTPGSPSGTLVGPNTFYVDAQGSTHVASQTCHTFAGSYRFARAPFGAGTSVVLNFSIKNVFDTWPPLDAGNFPYSPYGDIRLRQIALGLRATF